MIEGRNAAIAIRPSARLSTLQGFAAPRHSYDVTSGMWGSLHPCCESYWIWMINKKLPTAFFHDQEDEIKVGCMGRSNSLALCKAKGIQKGGPDYLRAPIAASASSLLRIKGHDRATGGGPAGLEIAATKRE